MASWSRDEKEIFFARLDGLDELALESEDNITSDSLGHPHVSIILHRACRTSDQKAPSSQVELTCPPEVTRLGQFAPSSQKVMPTQSSNRRSRSGRPTPKLSRRQSSKKSLQLQTEDAQIFRGLTFYFLPNNDIAMARKKRIQKSQEYGAAWAREWSAGVTHVIVDRGLSLSDVKKAIGADRLQQRHIIVNETYPPDCIKFQVLLPVHFIRFQVACDGIASALKAVKQNVLKGSSIPAEGGFARLAVSENVITAVQDGNDELKPVTMSRRPISVSAADKVERSVADTNFEGPKSDELDRFVAEMQETADLPLGSEDEGFEPSSPGSTSDSDDLRQEKMQWKKSKRPAAAPFDALRNFSCMRKNEGLDQSTNPNFRTIEKLEKMAHYYDRTGDRWRTIAYRKCVTALKRQSEYITTREQAMKIPGIGERLASKVEEVACTNRLRRLESAALDPNDQLLQLFTGIYQVGLPTASRWIAQGYKSLEDLHFKADLTANQRIGLTHYDDFLARIPRTEVMAHADIVRKACAKADPEIQLIIGGSYRRGAADCGDIDLIITKRNASLANIRVLLIDTVIPQLFGQGFLKVGLANCSSASRDQGSKWHGASAVPESRVWRRIDFLFVPWDELGAALIYFTGNDIFNRSIRLLASKKKMRLNQHGLYGDVMRGEKRERVTQGKLLESKSEERIFEILGVPWRPPEHRIC